MFMNEVPISADLPALIINELRDIYGIKYRKDKKYKNTQVKDIEQMWRCFHDAQNKYFFHSDIGCCFVSAGWTT